MWHYFPLDGLEEYWIAKGLFVCLFVYRFRLSADFKDAIQACTMKLARLYLLRSSVMHGAKIQTRDVPGYQRLYKEEAENEV